MPLNENALSVLEQRYLQPGEHPTDLWNRVATYVANGNRKDRDDFYDLMERGDFLPNSPTLSGAGTGLKQLSACFVLPVGDSIAEIYDAVKNAVIIHKSGGGTGFAFSRLREKGALVQSTRGVAGGPVSFMKVFDAATSSIAQGSVRHGANMGILHVDHPDIREFIHMKDDKKTLSNFNISVAATEAFMEAAANPGMPYPYRENDGLFREIVESAWATGDPGMIFIDRMNAGRSNPCPEFGPIEATNPCGEQPLYPFDSCNLGSINLANFVRTGAAGTPTIAYDALAVTVAKAVRFLDNVVEVNEYPLPEIDHVSRNIRRIGLGVMGWADMLFKLKIPYASSRAVDLAKSVMASVQQAADAASEMLAKERGAFPAWENSIYGPNGMNRPFRNSTRTTIAPTGTISIIAGCSSGIEPVYALSFKRQHNLDKSNPNARVTMYETNPVFREFVSGLDLLNAEEKKALIEDPTHPRYKGIIPDYFQTAGDIDPEWHILHQASFQQFTDNAVSKTINMPNSATVEDVARAYVLAWEQGCKGITVYRDGCRDEQVLSADDRRIAKGIEIARETHLPIGVVIKADDPIWNDFKPGDIVTNKIFTTTIDLPDPVVPSLVSPRRKMPRTAKAERHKLEIDGHDGYFIIGMYDDGSLGEIFVKLDKEGSMASGFADSFAKAVSIGLQYGVPLSTLTQGFKGVRFEPSGRTMDPVVPSCTSVVDYVARWLEHRFLDKPEVEIQTFNGNGCPECGERLVQAEGCEKCLQCNYTRCS